MDQFDHVDSILTNRFGNLRQRAEVAKDDAVNVNGNHGARLLEYMGSLKNYAIQIFVFFNLNLSLKIYRLLFMNVTISKTTWWNLLTSPTFAE